MLELVRWVDRMTERHFPPDDPRQREVRDAKNAMHTLWLRLHYMQCTGGVGDALEKPDEQVHWRPVTEPTGPGWIDGP